MLIQERRIGRLLVAGAAWLPTALVSCGEGDKAGGPRPNILIILADDLGFSDIGCYGGEIETPNLDALAANGIRYSQFYNVARSCPSRASLLTGLTPHQAGVGHLTADRGYPGYRGTLAPGTVTLAEALRGAGYQTAMTGKWHVSAQTKPDGPRDNWPLQRGFDKFYGTLPGHGSFFDPKGLFEGNTPVRAEGDFYYTEATTDHAVKYLQEFDPASPFFMYVAYAAPHYPIQARQEYIDKYDAHFAAGWDELRGERFRKLSAMGMFPDGTELSPADEQCYPWADEEYKEWQQNRMQVYAGMVEQMDEGIGRIVEELRRSGRLDNTLIFFLSDNGASNEGHLHNTIERTGAPWRDPMIPDSTRDGRRVVAGDLPGIPLGGPDTYGSYGPQWAHLSATPFRRYKSWVHEGGITTPAIAHWPNAIKEGGAIRHGVFSIIDFMPTLLELSGAQYPAEIRSLPTYPLPGVSFAESFGHDYRPQRLLFWEHEGNKAVRAGRWKLVTEHPGSWNGLRTYPHKGAWELYDMEADRTETRNLAAGNLALVDSLARLWIGWAESHKVSDFRAMGGEKW